MYIVKLAYLYNKLVKQALDVPDWVHTQFRDKLSNIPEESIKKDPRLVNFRIPIDQVPELSEEDKKFQATGDELEFLRAVSESFYILSNAYFNLKIIFDSIDDKQLSDFADRGRMIATTAETILSEEKLGPEAIHNNKITIEGREYRLGKFYNDQREKAVKLHKKLAIILEQYKGGDDFDKSGTDYKMKAVNNMLNKEVLPFDKITGYREWINANSSETQRNLASFEVVFTTKPEDIIGMSSRSGWRSCQTISSDRDFEEGLGTGYAKRILDSVKSCNVGIIYITDKSLYKDRGERMLYRSAVWIASDSKGKDILLLQPIYPSYSELISKIFENSLKANINIPLYNNARGESLADIYSKLDFNAIEYGGPYDDSFLNANINKKLARNILKPLNIIQNAKATLLKYITLPAISDNSIIRSSSLINMTRLLRESGFTAFSDKDFMLLRETIIDIADKPLKQYAVDSLMKDDKFNTILDGVVKKYNTIQMRNKLYAKEINKLMGTNPIKNISENIQSIKNGKKELQLALDIFNKQDDVVANNIKEHYLDLLIDARTNPEAYPHFKLMNNEEFKEFINVMDDLDLDNFKAFLSP